MQTAYSTFLFGDMRLDYFLCDGVMTMRLIPKNRIGDVADKQKCAGEPLAQLHIVGDVYPGGFSQGRTMRDGETTQRMKFVSQTASENRVETLLRDDRGLEIRHVVRYETGAKDLHVSTSLKNGTGKTIGLEMLSSFTLGGITPFCDGIGDLRLNRLLSCWSNEGQPLHQTAEEMQIEPAWADALKNTLRFGQVGSMPVRGWAPVAGVTDAKAGVTWAAKLTHASSWQLEMARPDDGFSLSGGLADREFGHFLKNIASGETFDAPEALITVTEEGFDEACFRMIDQSKRKWPENEKGLPSLFNEWCTTWGVPSEENIRKITTAIRGHGFRYFVIDAGWFIPEDRVWYNSAGDWVISKKLFPNGIDVALDAVRENGLVPGIWFELEVAGEGAQIFRNDSLFLKRDGYPIQVGVRRFFDFTLPEARAYLKGKVIDFLNAHRLGYIKVDYNENIGIGADGAESQGEKLRLQVNAVLDFFDEMRESVPGLTIEICSSGGHRLVPAFLERGNMASFSDAHECDEIPVVAKNVLRLIEMRKSQIWAVIHKEQDLQKIYYKVTGGMLGRICISGDVLELSDEQWKAIDDGVKFHEGNYDYLLDARTRFLGTPIVSARHPTGWQAVERIRPEGMLIVAHTFRNAPETVELDCEGEIEAVCARDGIRAELRDGKLVLSGLRNFDGVAVRTRSSKI